VLTKILSSQVGQVWEALDPMIRGALNTWTGFDERNLTNIMEALMSDNLHGWLVEDDEQKIVYGLVTTNFTYDEFGGDKMLNVYTMFTVKTVPIQLISEAIETLTVFAKGNNCKGICGFANNPKIVQLAERYGADTNITLINWRF